MAREFGVKYNAASAFKYCIHPDSQDTFEPQQFDFGISNKDVPYQYMHDQWLDTSEDKPDYIDGELVSIVQRNNKPFFIPEVEHD